MFDQAQQRWLDFLNKTCPTATSPQHCVLEAYHKRSAGYRAQLAGDAFAESRLTPEQHARIQQSLVTGGFLDEKPDGEFGPNTRSAIKRFKSQSGLPESEFLTTNERENLLQGKTSTSRNERGPPSPPTGSIVVPLQKLGGTYVVPVRINNTIVLNFVVDSGAADVSIPADVVLTLSRTGTIQASDFIGTQTYTLADGSTIPSAMFRVRSLTVGSNTVENVTASVARVESVPLLGLSFLSRFKSVSIDNAREALVLEPLGQTIVQPQQRELTSSPPQQQPQPPAPLKCGAGPRLQVAGCILSGYGPLYCLELRRELQAMHHCEW